MKLSTLHDNVSSILLHIITISSAAISKLFLQAIQLKYLARALKLLFSLSLQEEFMILRIFLSESQNYFDFIESDENIHDKSYKF